MAASTAGALKALIESLGLGLSAYRDEPPGGFTNTPRPYVTILENVHTLADPAEDGQLTTGVETCQVDLWEDWKNLSTGALAESYTLRRDLRKGMHFKRLALIGTAVTYVVLVTGDTRLLESEENLVHIAYTLEVHRELG